MLAEVDGPAGVETLIAAVLYSFAAAPRGSSSQDAVSALQNLGFKPNVATDAVARALEELGEGAGLNDLVRVALKRVAG